MIVIENAALPLEDADSDTEQWMRKRLRIGAGMTVLAIVAAMIGLLA